MPVRGFKRPQSRAIRRFLIPFLLVLAIPTLFTTITYFRTLSVTEEKMIRINQSLLERAVSTVDRRLDEIDNLVEQIAHNSKIQRFHTIEEPFSPRHIFEVLDTRSHLYSHNLSNSLVLAYYIYFKSNDIVMAPKTTYRAPLFYSSAIEYEGVAYDQWRTQMSDEFHSKRFVPATLHALDGVDWMLKSSVGRPVIRYLNSVGNRQFLRGTIEFLLDVSTLTEELGGLQIMHDGLAYIVDPNGDLLAAVGDIGTEFAPLSTLGRGAFTTRINGTSMLVTHSQSEKTGWSFVVAQPRREVMQEVVYLRALLFLLGGASILAGLFVAFILARREGVPFTGLVGSGGEYVGLDTDERLPGYEQLRSAVFQVIDDNVDLQGALDDQKPLLRNTFFFRLLHGGFDSREDIEAVLDHVDLSMQGRRHVVALLHLTGDQEADYHSSDDLLGLDVRRLLLTSYVEKQRENILVHALDQHRVALIVNSDPADPQRFNARVRELIPEIATGLLSQLKLRITIGVGGVVDSLLDVAHSYEQAYQAMNAHILDRSSTVTWYDDLPEAQPTIYFPMNMETRLQNAVRSGNEDLVVSILDELYRANAVARHPSLSGLRLFLGELLACLARSLDQMRIVDNSVAAGIEAGADKVYTSTDFGWVYSEIVNLYRTACGGINTRKQMSNRMLVESITTFIRERYADPQMCLSLLSTEFNLSEVYISTLYKEQTGENFYKSLELIRLNAAQELLRGSSRSVKEIAHKVGYSSVGTFGRAFKRTFGMRPSDYRAVSSPV